MLVVVFFYVYVTFIEHLTHQALSQQTFTTINSPSPLKSITPIVEMRNQKEVEVKILAQGPTVNGRNRF